jgi:hypothetical protein
VGTDRKGFNMSNCLRSVYCGLALSVLLVSVQTQAQDPTIDTGGGPARAFGDKGEVAISSDAALVVQHSSQDVTTISIAPAADFFVIKNLSLGGELLFEYSKTGSNDATRFGIGPRVGYNLAFTDMLGIWPKIGFSFSHTSHSATLADANSTSVVRSTSGNAFTLNLFAPIMLHPVQHFFVGFGPFLDTDLSGSQKVTTYGLKLTMGGWFNM